jgi:hypothetical protein
MAKDRAVASVGRALTKLLQAHCPASLSTNASFASYGPADFEDPMKQGLSLMLYRVAISATPRNRSARRDADGRQWRPSLPLDLHYLLTPWSSTAEGQHLLLGWAMRFLEDRSVLPAGVLNAYDAEPDTFGPEEAVELICEPLSLTDHLQIWDKLKTKMPVSVSYVVRMLLLDSTLEVGTAPAVRTRELLLPAQEGRA